MRIAFHTLGCKVNQYETEAMKEAFVSRGAVIVSEDEAADAYIVNTCTVTNIADRKSRQFIRRMHSQNPDALIVVTGCYAQVAGDALAAMPEVDMIIGNSLKSGIAGMVCEALEKGGAKGRGGDAGEHPVREVLPYEELTGYDDMGIVSAEESSKCRAYIKIEEGCDRFCSYCLIPFARGRVRSRGPEEIAAEAKALISGGCREIVLTGINIAFYGHREGLRLADAVEVCCCTEGIERVRLGSIEPEMMLPDDLDRLAALPQFCPQFHLSLQSGCAATLKRMNRRYTPEEYASLVEQIRSRFPEAAFTTDIMVGFPRETEEEFAESMAFAERIGFSRIHVFQYSPRQGTPAAKMEQIPDAVKHERADRMKALGERLAREYMQGLVGRTMPVLFEREKSPDFHCGHAPDYTLIKISRKNSKKSLRNQIFYVTIEGVGDDCCLGRIASEDGN
jgi:threonylcarbamoyladenosine tRNA methylthiotransferase MtaB